MSLVKYVLNNPKFSFWDKFQYFGYYLIVAALLFLIFWGGYKGIKEGYNISIIEISVFIFLIIPFIKYTKYLTKKFTIPYKISLGETEKIKNLETEFNKGSETVKNWSNFVFKYYLLFVIPIAIFILFIFFSSNKFYSGLTEFPPTENGYNTFRYQILYGGIILILFWVLAIFYIIKTRKK